MGQGIAAIFVESVPVRCCTTREVLGIGVPQVTAISDVAADHDATWPRRVVPVIANGDASRASRQGHRRRADS